jgi:cytochrome P450
VLLAPWVVHRHPQFWEEPERFDPERFTPEREKARHRYAWCPFGGGPRGCMGQHFSMLESVIALAVLVRDPVALPDPMYQQPGSLTIVPESDDLISLNTI